jgi:hypothetical protein
LGGRGKRIADSKASLGKKLAKPCLKNNENQRGEYMAQGVECLFSMCKALSSNSSAMKKRKKYTFFFKLPSEALVRGPGGEF